MTNDPRWEAGAPPENLQKLLGQRFTYLKSGGQCYAFLSEDGKYVVKFFKYHLRRVPWILAHLPLPAKYAKLREKQRINREKKLLRDFSSYKLAYEELREESGLVFIHLNKTENLNLRLTVVDKLHIEHSLNLDQLEFVIQDRATLAFAHFETLIKENQISEAKESIDSMLHLLVSRCQKGIYDEDPRLHRNLGFVGAKAILIDVGRLRPDTARTSHAVYVNDVQAITDELRVWLLKHSPELAGYLQERVAKL